MPTGESEDRAKTRERFNEVFKKYTESERKKGKKKSHETQETIVLQNLKKNLNLAKDTEDDETTLQNTYQLEQGSPRYTKNKRREKETAEKVNTDINKNQEEVQTSKAKKKTKRELPSLPAPKEPPSIVQEPDTELEPRDEEGGKSWKQKSRKGKSKEDAETKTETQAEDAEDELLRDYQQQLARVDARTKSVPLNNDVGKKKKKKLKSVPADSDAGDHDEAAELDVDNKTESAGKKKKKKQKHTVRGESDGGAEAARPTVDDGLVLGVYVHRTDRLKTDLLLSHPMVKIHVVDEATGQYVKKDDCHRPVSSFYEQENVEHILPIMTQPFDFKKNKSMIPEWDEQIIFNERFGFFLQENEQSPRVLLFFEILDFMTMEEARADAGADKHERGFRKVAWAFLKLVGTNGAMNVGSKLRLQLFCPLPQTRRHPKTIEVVEWWRRFPRHKYSSTLYVTVKGIRVPEHVDPSIRSMMALQEERGSTSYTDLHDEVTRRSRTQLVDTKLPALRWSRLPGQVCRIPNKPALAFCGGQSGCLTLLFSHAGTLLAAACADRDAFPIVVYEIPSGRVLAAFSGHLKVVYDLCWSADDRSLLSASSDGTVREWNVEQLVGAAQSVLPHPSFVYCAQYHPTAHSLVVTGGYDCLIRVWRLDVDSVYGQLLHEFDGHDSFINTLCFDSEGRRMFSADNVGRINVWKSWVSDSSQQQQQQQQPSCQRWCIEKSIDDTELSGVPVHKLQLHPNGRCLLVHAKDSVLRMMDLRILAVKKYTGATNYRERICSTFTPCGSFIFSGSEDGMAYVWNTDTGDQVAVYSELCYSTALHGVAFHPHDNMAAFCAFGQGQPIHVYSYDRRVSQLEVQKLKAASSSASVTDAPDPTGSRDAAAEQLAPTARLALKMQCVKEQLDSVLDPHPRPSGSFCDRDTTSVSHTARSSTSDAAAVRLNASLPPPSLLSPHSKLQLCGSVAEQLIPQAARSHQHRSHFSPVGLSRASSFRPQTTFPGPAASLGVSVETDGASVEHVVVSLYSYRANRSDELTLRRGDVIHVLYKDNDSWWFGRLLNGLQGYFLASYVVDQRDFSEETSHSTDDPAERSTPTRVSAALNYSGELHFLSEPPLSDTEPELTDSRPRRKKRVKKPGPPSLWSETPVSDASASGRRGRPTTRPLPQRPTGRINGAFEPDA